MSSAALPGCSVPSAACVCTGDGATRPWADKNRHQPERGTGSRCWGRRSARDRLQGAGAGQQAPRGARSPGAHLGVTAKGTAGPCPPSNEHRGGRRGWEGVLRNPAKTQQLQGGVEPPTGAPAPSTHYSSPCRSYETSLSLTLGLNAELPAQRSCSVCDHPAFTLTAAAPCYPHRGKPYGTQLDSQLRGVTPVHDSVRP